MTDRYTRPYGAFKIDNVWQDVTADIQGLDGKSGMDIVHGQLNQTARISYGSCNFKLNNGISRINPAITSRYSFRNPSSDLYGKLYKNIPFRAGVDRLVCNFNSTVANGWGNTDTTGITNQIPGVAWALDGTASAFNVSSGTGTIVSTGTTALRVAKVGSYGEVEALVKFKISSLTTDPQFGLAFYHQASNEYYGFYFDTTGTDSLKLVHNKAGNQTAFNTTPISFSIVADTYYWMHVTVGKRFRCNVWPDSGAERSDGGWDFSLFDGDPFNFGPTDPFGGVGPFVCAGTNTTVLTVDYFECFNPRFYGELSDLIPNGDGTNNYLYADAEASGIFRRLRVGEQANLDSPIYRMATKASTLPFAAAYWTGEDTQQASSVSSGLIGGQSMTINGALPSFGGETRMPGSKPMMKLAAGELVGVVPQGGTFDTTGKIYYRMMMVTPDTEIANNAEIVRINTFGVVAFFTLTYGTGGSLNLRAHDNTGAVVDQTGSVTFGGGFLPLPGLRFYFSIEVVQSGADITVLTAMNWISPDGTTIFAQVFNDTFTGLSFGSCTSIVIGTGGGIPGVGMGHIGVGNNQQFMFSNAAINGFAGETVGVRLLRLCTENNLDLYFVGANIDTALCGPQQTGTLEYNLQLAADTDQGILFEPRGSLSVGYITRSALYNQRPAVASYTGDYYSGSLSPTEDDSLTANDVTATSVSGGSARIIVDSGPNNNQPPPVGIGVYHPNPTLNVMPFTQSQLVEIAGHRALIGTWDSARFPKISFNLARDQYLANPNLRAFLLYLGEGNYLQMTNPPSWLPINGMSTVDLMTQGYKETFGQFMHVTILNTTPYGPYLIGQIDEVTSRVAGGTDIVLVEAVNNSATNFIIKSASGTQRWCYVNDDAFSAADFPMDAMIEGERVTITAVSPAIKDSFTRNVDPGWGTADTGDAWAMISGPTLNDFTVVGTEANILTNTTPAVRTIAQPDIFADGEVFIGKLVIAGGAVATGAPISVGIVTRFTGISGTDSYLFAELLYSTSDTVTARINQIVTGVSTLLASAATGLAGSGTAFALRFKFSGPYVFFKVWNRSLAEPKDWTCFSSGATGWLNAGKVGIWQQLTTGNTNPSITFAYDNFQLFANQQNLTVTRSVNGISKSHGIGASIDVVERAYVGR